MKSVCKGCEPHVRYSGCHDHCPKYLEAKKEDLELKQKIKAENKGRNEMTKYYAEKKNKRIKKFGEDVW